jgi:23S rRNA maturation-related 3'-5' exoribonuclease YhaM
VVIADMEVEEEVTQVEEDTEEEEVRSILRHVLTHPYHGSY